MDTCSLDCRSSVDIGRNAATRVGLTPGEMLKAMSTRKTLRRCARSYVAVPVKSGTIAAKSSIGRGRWSWTSTFSGRLAVFLALAALLTALASLLHFRRLVAAICLLFAFALFFFFAFAHLVVAVITRTPTFVPNYGVLAGLRGAVVNSVLLLRAFVLSAALWVIDLYTYLASGPDPSRTSLNLLLISTRQ